MLKDADKPKATQLRKLGTTAAERYAHISEENQRVLIEVLGDELGDNFTYYCISRFLSL